MKDNNGHDLMICLGRYEMRFLANEGPLQEFCNPEVYSDQKWTLAWFACITFPVIQLATSQNFIELFMLWRVVRHVKETTNNSKSLLSLKAFERRQK